MDFENYTLGKLFSDRSNYDMEHPGHQAAVAHVLGTVWSLGWRKDHFGRLDSSLDYPRTRSEPSERYGKKYGWIGFRSYAGLLSGDNSWYGRDIFANQLVDPSFPVKKIEVPLHLPDWTISSQKDDRNWMKRKVEVPRQFLNPKDLAGEFGPWIATSGYLADRKQGIGRESVWLYNGIAGRT